MKANLSLFFGAVQLSVLVGEIYLQRRNWYAVPDYPPKCLYWDAQICSMYEEYNPHGYRLRPSSKSQYLSRRKIRGV
jgi:hypothetical protein